jgi:hypothetical protein
MIWLWWHWPFDSRYRAKAAISKRGLRKRVHTLNLTRVMRSVRQLGQGPLTSAVVREIAFFQRFKIIMGSLVVILMAIYLFYAINLYPKLSNRSVGGSFDVPLTFVGFVLLEILVVLWFLNLQRELLHVRAMSQILAQLSYLSLELDWLDREPFNVRRQRVVMRRFESCAQIIERYPRVFHLARGDEDGIVISRACVGIAAQFRRYKVWVAMPVETTSTDLVEIVAETIHLVWRRKWSELGSVEVTINNRINLLHRLGWLLSAGVLVVALVYVAYNQSALGAAGSTISSILALVIVFVLSRLGVNISTLQQAADVANKTKIETK